ncbi:hypothetical protein POTOM_035071 [Populus tomentosa]|uniref:SMC hinge domain-containing protein n=1 Tax=Populus tomentosa TaxID=118781 RepID=A0A8X7Z2D7_POPTO|nr:hypothetical protein POTOM_035071 [Populus tomentosa]
MHIKQVIIEGFKSYREQIATEPFSPKVNCVGKVDKEEVRLRRTIGLKKDEYFLDGKHITKTEVMNLLESAGFSRSNPYYVVQQGKIASLTLMKDSERLDLLKEIGGTRVYEERRRNKRKQIIQVVQYLDERLKELDEEKEELRKYQQLDKQRKSLEYTIYDKELHDARQKLLEVEEARSKVSEKSAKMYNDVLNAHEESKDLEKKEIQDSQKELNKINGPGAIVLSTTRILKLLGPSDVRRGLNSIRRICREYKISGVFGPIIELLDCDEKYFTAVEVTAGNRVQQMFPEFLGLNYIHILLSTVFAKLISHVDQRITERVTEQQKIDAKRSHDKSELEQLKQDIANANKQKQFISKALENKVDKEEVRLRRTIGLKKDEYFLDGKHITKTEVMNLLESAGFSRSNPYYVVQQGKIASLTLMKDSERLDLLKEIGGTRVYEERRRNKRKQIIQVVQYLDERLKELDEEKEELRKYQQLTSSENL